MPAVSASSVALISCYLDQREHHPGDGPLGMFVGDYEDLSI